MNRKDFLTSSLIGASSISSLSKIVIEDENSLIPPYLKKGDLIGICSPAGFVTAEEIQPSVLQMQSWGYRIKLGSSIGKRDFGFGGTDQERLSDLQQMLDDNSIKAIMCARGGYGSVRIVDRIKWAGFKLHPKWVIGFSDITVLHSHINRNLGIASIHSKMCNSFPDDWAKAEPIQRETIESIRKALAGEKMKYSFSSLSPTRSGTAEGVLVGGNLKTIESLAGSSSDLFTKGKILFLEDTGEYLYSIDRMFWNLKRTGKLDHLAALIVGGFKIKPDDPGEEFGRSLYDIVWEKVKEYNYPVCFDFPVGHQRNNFALKCGARHKLSVGRNDCSLSDLEI